MNQVLVIFNQSVTCLAFSVFWLLLLGCIYLALSKDDDFRK